MNYFSPVNILEKLQNIPALKAAVILSLGILIGSSFNINHILIFIILSVLLAASAIYLIYYSNAIIGFILIGSMIMAFGIFRAGLDEYVLPENSIAYIPDTPPKTDYKLTGIINDIPDYDSTRIRFNIEADGLITQTDTISVDGEVITTIFKSKYKDNINPPIFKAGDRIEITGRLLTPWGERNPGEFDYKKYLETQDIYKSFLTFGYENVNRVSGGNLGFIEQELVFPAKYFATETIDRNMSGDEAEYLKGLVTGQRNDISAEIKDAFVKTGVMHLIAVSGLNVAYVIIIIVTLLSIFRVYFRWKTALVISVLIFYCLFTGNSPSIVRATIMGILLLIAYDTERKVNFYNVVGFSAFVILIFNTKQLFDPGFILSYTAVISMVFCYEKFKPYLVEWYDGSGKWYRRWTKYALILFVTTLAAQVGVLPVTGNYFEKVSIVSLPANLIIVPMANISLAIGFMQILAAGISGYLSSVIANANSFILSIQLSIIKFFAEWDFAYFEVFRFDGVTIAAYFAALILLLTMTRKNFKFRIILVIIIAAGIFIHNIRPEDKLRVSFLDTGDGKCTVIQTPEGRTILVDCGISTETYDSAERTIIPYLKRNGIDKADLLILTGMERTKTGGLDHFTENFPVSKILMNTPGKLNSSAPVENVTEGDYIDIIENARIYFLTGGSMILKYNELDILFAEGNDGSMDYLYEKYGDFIDADIIRTNSLIENLQPSIYVTSISSNSKAFDAIKEKCSTSGIQLFNTNREGALIIQSSGDNIEIMDWK